MKNFCEIPSESLLDRIKRWWKRFTNCYNSPIYKWLFPNRIQKFEAYVYPIIKTFSPSLLIGELIKVQPMQGPIGQVFYLDFKYKAPKKWYQFWKRK